MAAAVDVRDVGLREACETTARLAARLLGAPTAVVTLAEGSAEVLGATIGVPGEWRPLQRLPAGVAFGTRVMATAAAEAVDDTRASGLPGLAGHGIGAYLSVPLLPRRGTAVGALVVATAEPRAWTADDTVSLAAIARLLVAEIERRVAADDARERTGALVRTTEALLAEIAQRERIEATLRESEARWRTLIEHAPEAILVYDVDHGRFVEANENAVRLFAVPRDVLLAGGFDVRGGPVRDGVRAPGNGPLHDDLDLLLRRALAGETPVTEWSVRSGRGHAVPCEMRLVRLPGSRSRVRASLTDISERHRAEQALRASEAALAEAQRVARMGSWELDFGSGAIHVSSGLRHLLGLPSADNGDEQQRFLAAMHPDDRELVVRTITSAIDGGVPYTLDHRLIAADGTELSVHHQGAVVEDPEGRPLHFVATLTDETARAAAERERSELLEREQTARRDAEAAHERLAFLAHGGERLAASLEVDSTLVTLAGLGVPDRASWSAVWLFDANGAAQRVDAGGPAAAPAAEGDRPAADATSASDPLESLVAEVLRTGTSQVRSGPPPHLVVPLRARQQVIGAMGWVARAPGLPYHADDVALAEALAGRGALALEAARLFEEARSANRMKDDFLATLSHELRTPLAAVLGWASLVRGDDLPPEAVDEALEAIERNARAQARLVDDVLEVSRIVSGKIRVSRRPVDLQPTIDAAVATLRPTAQAKNVALTVTPPTVPALVLGDPDRLQQVWANVLANAIKFTPAGGRVNVALSAGSHGATVRVRDTGEGIPADVLPHVFDRFRQGDSSSTRRHGGLGIGLALVRHFVELHGGTVAAHSDGPGHGTELVVRLPPLDTSTSLPLAGAPRSARSARPLEGLRVLVIDDDAEMRTMMRAVLGRRGAVVTEAASSVEGLAAVERDPPDVVLSDVQMPDEDGYAFVRRLRERADARAIPAAAVTAHAGEEHRARALAAGFQAQVAKPLDAETLAGVVAELVRVARVATG